MCKLLIECSRDQEEVRLTVTASNQNGQFRTESIASLPAIEAQVDDARLHLSRLFKNANTPILELRFGHFGKKFAVGATCITFQYEKPRNFLVTLELETEPISDQPQDFARLHFKADPSCLDAFLEQLREVAKNSHGIAELVGQSIYD